MFKYKTIFIILWSYAPRFLNNLNESIHTEELENDFNNRNIILLNNTDKLKEDLLSKPDWYLDFKNFDHLKLQKDLLSKKSFFSLDKLDFKGNYHNKLKQDLLSKNEGLDTVTDKNKKIIIQAIYLQTNEELKKFMENKDETFKKICKFLDNKTYIENFNEFNTFSKFYNLKYNAILIFQKNLDSKLIDNIDTTIAEYGRIIGIINKIYDSNNEEEYKLEKSFLNDLKTKITVILNHKKIIYNN